jgi:hypothetical protein
VPGGQHSEGHCSRVNGQETVSGDTLKRNREVPIQENALLIELYFPLGGNHEVVRY